MPVAPVDPLFVLSKAPTVIAAAAPAAAPAVAEELTDLTDDAGLEEWASSGTKVMPKAAPQPVAPTMVSSPLPSFYPVAYSTAPRIQEKKKTSAAIWVVPLALFVFAGGIVAAAGGWYVYHANELAKAAAAAVDTSSNVTTSAPIETAAPAVTLTTTAAPTVAATATPSARVTATATPTATVNTSTRHGSSMTSTSTSTSTNANASPYTSSASNGSIRTFAAGNGKPVYVDGKQVGYGGGRITTACGHHMVAVGSGQAKSVNIPCNGQTLTVGSPDGN